MKRMLLSILAFSCFTGAAQAASNTASIAGTKVDVSTKEGLIKQRDTVLKQINYFGKKQGRISGAYYQLGEIAGAFGYSTIWNTRYRSSKLGFTKAGVGKFENASIVKSPEVQKIVRRLNSAMGISGDREKEATLNILVVDKKLEQLSDFTGNLHRQYHQIVAKLEAKGWQ